MIYCPIKAVSHFSNFLFAGGQILPPLRAWRSSRAAASSQRFAQDIYRDNTGFHGTEGLDPASSSSWTRVHHKSIRKSRWNGRKTFTQTEQEVFLEEADTMCQTGKVQFKSEKVIQQIPFPGTN